MWGSLMRSKYKLVDAVFTEVIRDVPDDTLTYA